MPRKKKKSRKERQRERQIKQERAQEAYRIRREREAEGKPRQWPKGKILGAVCLLVLIFGAYGAWQYTRPSATPAGGAIYIRADGLIDPSMASISNDGNIYYTFTATIQGSIVIERDNIVVDGANNALQGIGGSDSKGIDLTGRSNVTITNTKIRDFEAGVHLSSAYLNVLSRNDLTNNVCGVYLEFSSNNTLSGNSITNNEAGVYLESSSNNTLSGNVVRNNELYSVHLLGGSDNVLSQNDLTNNEAGVYLEYSSYNAFVENSIANNQYGIWLYESSLNSIHYNNFTDNAEHVHSQASTNFWDDEYSRGNYWSDYKERYPDAKELDGSGIWNTPYVIDENNQDDYPLVDI